MELVYCRTKTVSIIADQVYTVKQALPKIAAYCAYQERSHVEVEEKLYGYGLDEDQVMEAIQWLREENFLNEERFARAYTRGKFNGNRWGKIKIRQGLRQKQITDRLADMAMEEIDTDEYYEVLKNLIRKKMDGLKETNHYKIRAKCFNYAAGKGFESSLINEAISDLLADR
ncbi:regulatory protein RecX [Limibacter armeniacum]|uniref:regulatory protein RecX n=1 Tax=Limibacter armeniacum TaxID=466084 RepID=UPI002FE6909A